MKKIYLLFFLLSFLFLFGIREVNAEEINYSYDFTDGMPIDWNLYERSDVNYTSITKSSNGFTVEHNNPGNVQPLYYGSLIQLGEEVSHLSDFTISIKLRFTSYMDNNRWFGIMYHTQYDSNNGLSGYMMCYRVGGKTHQSTASVASTFADSLVVESTGVPMSDMSFHTVKITCSGSNVTHYIDDNEIVSYDYCDYSSTLPCVQNEGGFALMVNKSSVEFQSIEISGTTAKPTAKLDSNIKELNDVKENLIGDLGVITRVLDLEHLESIKNSYTQPNTAIISVDKDMNVLDKDGNSINLDLNTVYNEYLTNVLPAISINDMEVAESFVKYYDTDFKYLDIFVSSNDEEVLGYLRSHITNIRGILDYSNKVIDDVGDLVHTANIAGANTIILSGVSYDDIRYIQSRFKTVWVEHDVFNMIDVVSSIVDGAYGIVCSSFEKVYHTLYKFADIEGMNFNRTSYNVAHRGLCISSYENSLEGYIKAYETGATHIEMDVHLSKDKEIVVMHDESINRTTNGTGIIANMTVDQLEQYKIIKNKNGSVIGEGVNIPLLRDIFEEFKGKDIIFVVEIKTNDLGFAEVFRDLLEEYDVMNQTVAISFNTNQLAKMKEIIPEIPTANLNAINSSSFASGAASSNSMYAGIFTNYGNGDPDFTRMAALRGYSSWYWAYELENDIKNAMINGVLGIANNSADSIGMYATRLIVDDNRIIMNKANFGKNVKLGAELYCGELDGTLEAKVVSIEFHGNYAYAIYTAIYSCSGISYNIFSDKIMLIDEEKYIALEDILEVLSKETLTEADYELLEGVEEAYELLTDNEKEQVDLTLVNNLLQNKNKKGCTGSVITSIFGLLTLAGAVLVVKRKK